MDQPTAQFRFKVPEVSPFSMAQTYSFGIEPWKINAKGKPAKAGKAIIRIVIHTAFPESRNEAIAAAQIITDLLNEGYEYLGPKTLAFDWSRNHIHPAGYLRLAGEAKGND
jgi:hypothetical protein